MRTADARGRELAEMGGRHGLISYITVYIVPRCLRSSCTVLNTAGFFHVCRCAYIHAAVTARLKAKTLIAKF